MNKESGQEDALCRVENICIPCVFSMHSYILWSQDCYCVPLLLWSPLERVAYEALPLTPTVWPPPSRHDCLNDTPITTPRTLRGAGTVQ